MSHWRCSGARSLAVLAAVSVCASALGRSADPSASSRGTLERLLDRSDHCAPEGESAEQSRARRTLLLDMIARSPRCFVPNPTQEQLDYILQHFNALPVGGVMAAGGIDNRFFTDNVVWNGNGSQGPSGQASRATLRYSFPNDGVFWDGGANNLNARFSAQFGPTNVDRGREYVRQGLAAWRRLSGLNYLETGDTNVSFSNSTGPVGGADVRIGSRPQGNGGVLAYNYFPSSGGDMTINSDELTTASMFAANTNNYRYFRNVIAHEHGHGLGYIHATPCNGTKLMEPFANTNFDVLQIDEIRGAHRNYGDRFAGNNSAANATDFGNLTSPIVKSIIQRNLSTNGASGPNGTGADWFKFTIGSAQNVSVTVAPLGGTYANGQQTGGCNPTNPGSINASAAGNLNIELRDSAGTTVLNTAAAAAAGSNETLTLNGLAAGTYVVRVFDVGPNSAQTVQLYDLTLRVGTSKAPPQAIAGLPKRVAAGQLCYFMGDINSRVTEGGTTLNNASYDWDLDGDGIFETNDQPQPTFTYNANGIYNATLRVTDSNGMSATDTITVTVVGAVSSISTISPNQGQTGATIPVTITGINLGGVTSGSQISISGGSISVSGTPVISGGGTTVSGLSFVIAPGATIGPRNITITNADGTGQVAVANNAFTVTNLPPANDVCSAPISWGTVTGPRPFTNVSATTGTPQSFPGTGCPASGPINNDVWYLWRSTANGNLQITTDSATAGSPTPFSSRVAVYSTTTCPPTTVIGCDDFANPFNVFVQGNRNYLIQVGSVNAGQTGTANVILTFTPTLGGCCDSSGNCTLLPSNECIGGNTWTGAGTTCEVPGCPIPPGNCCLPDGTCTVEADSSTCSGIFAPGGVCEPNPCDQPVGACCAPSGACVMSVQADCSTTWTSGGMCEPNPCPQPTGACCVGSACSTTTEAECAGTWQGAATSCSPNPCAPPTGACCNGAACSVTTQAACTGAYQGDASACGAPGNPTTCCPANFNQTGGVTVQDIFDFLAAYFSNDPAANFNGAGGITVQDIFDYLAAYFTGCPG